MNKKWEPPLYKLAGAYGHVGVDDEEYEKVSQLIANYESKSGQVLLHNIKEVQSFWRRNIEREEKESAIFVAIGCLSPLWFVLSLFVVSMVARWTKGT